MYEGSLPDVERHSRCNPEACVGEQDEAVRPYAFSAEERNRCITAIFLEHHRAVRSYLARFLRSEEDIADTVQEVFVRIAQLADPFKADLHPRAFLFRIAENLVVDRVRREKVRQFHLHSPFEHDDIESDAPSVETQVAWFRAMARIQASLQDAGKRVVNVVELSCLQDLSHHEIAGQLGVSVRTVERCMRRARQVCEPYLASV